MAVNLHNVSAVNTKKIVCTLNVGRNVIHDNARASMREAARRWGANYLEILIPTGDVGQHYYYQKLQLSQHLPDNTRVVYYDGDVVIRSDCPSPFDIVPEGMLGLVRSHTFSHGGASQSVYDPMRAFGAEFGVDFHAEAIHDSYPNTGMMLLEFPLHRVIFEEMNQMVERRGFDSRWQIADQGFISVAVKKLQVSVFWMPPMLQQCGAILWEGWSAEMKTLGYHFCGPINENIGIPRTVWDDLGPDRKVFGTNITRWIGSKPLHLTGGEEIPMFMREMSRIRNGCIVEIGCFMGGSTWYGAQIARDNFCRYICVDSWRGASDLSVDNIHYEGFIENMTDAGLLRHIEIIRALSADAAKLIPDNSVDLVFIDADHTRIGCAADILAYWPKLKVGGVMLGHDYCERLHGVIEAVADIFGTPDEVSSGPYPIWKKTKTSSDDLNARVP